MQTQKEAIVMIGNRYKKAGISKEGGMGEVHEYVDSHLNRRVVLKTLKEGEEVRRLIDEQRALLHIRSKYVVQLFDIVTYRDTHERTISALVLEYIDGTDLKSGSFNPDETYLKTLWQIASGLAEIHSAGVIHRDIKPNNIRIDSQGVVKIFDFGLARKAKGDQAQTGNIIGTIGYMAPELWSSGIVNFDFKTDVYAFGVTALSLLDIKLPKELVRRPPVAIPEGTIRLLLPVLPQSISELIQKCLSYDAKDRPNMHDVTETLAHYLLKGRHRAHLVIGGQLHEISSKKRTVNLRVTNIGEIEIYYDDFTFKVANTSGRVDINNSAAASGQILPLCCVLTFGTGVNRSFVTFDVSNPEVMP